MTTMPKDIDVTTVNPQDIPSVLGANVRAIIVERSDGTLAAYVPERSTTLAAATPTKPAKVVQCEGSGWTCGLVNGKWVCTRKVGDLTLRKTVA
jgi:hypothetical protein